MKVIFLDRYERRREVEEVDTLQKGYDAVHEFLKKHHYEIPYTRMWIEENEIWFDVGSHTEFFIVEFESAEAAERNVEEWVTQDRLGYSSSTSTES